MNDIFALLLPGLLLFIVQCQCDHGNRDLAGVRPPQRVAGREAMHPELFTPGSKDDRLDRVLFAAAPASRPRVLGGASYGPTWPVTIPHCQIALTVLSGHWTVTEWFDHCAVPQDLERPFLAPGRVGLPRPTRQLPRA